jgi:hypothetical protein
MRVCGDEAGLIALAIPYKALLQVVLRARGV